MNWIVGLGSLMVVVIILFVCKKKFKKVEHGEIEKKIDKKNFFENIEKKIDKKNFFENIDLENIDYNSGSKDLKVAISKVSGRGMIADRDFKKGELLDVCPVIEDKITHYDGQSRISDYIFRIGNNVFMPLGNCSMYNHSKNPNAVAALKDDKFVIVLKDDVSKGSEIFIDYGKDYWHQRNLLTEARRKMAETTSGDPNEKIREELMTEAHELRKELRMLKEEVMNEILKND